ncbi:MAG: hypothetical protein HZB65_03220 [Candidatus Aenigmarchaeota archaeon]|nr:hypothetical protein [Candidatus Aenigmarchaeota archaeon]
MSYQFRIPYGVEIINDHTIKYKTSEGSKKIDLSEIVKSEQKFLKVADEMGKAGLVLKYLKMPSESGWAGFDESTGMVWDYINNYGFATKVFPNTDAGKKEARNSLAKAFTQGIYFKEFESENDVINLLSYQPRRKKGTKEVVPVYRFSDGSNGPAGVYANWDSRGFGDRSSDLGCLFVNAQKTREIVISSPEEAEKYAQALAKYTQTLNNSC